DQQAGGDDRHDDRQQVLQRGQKSDPGTGTVVQAIDQVMALFGGGWGGHGKARLGKIGGFYSCRADADSSGCHRSAAPAERGASGPGSTSTPASRLTTL